MVVSIALFDGWVVKLMFIVPSRGEPFVHLRIPLIPEVVSAVVVSIVLFDGWLLRLMSIVLQMVDAK